MDRSMHGCGKNLGYGNYAICLWSWCSGFSEVRQKQLRLILNGKGVLS